MLETLYLLSGCLWYTHSMDETGCLCTHGSETADSLNPDGVYFRETEWKRQRKTKENKLFA